MGNSIDLSILRKHAVVSSSVPLRIIGALGNSLLMLLALGTLGSFLPGLPGIGELGPILTAQLGLWTTILAAIGAAIVLLRWRANQRASTLLLAGLGAFAALGSGYVHARQIGVAVANGAQIDLGEALLASAQAHAGPKPTTIVYSRYDGQDLPLDLYPPTGKLKAALAPVFVYIHGGGWGAETLKQRQADYHWFARRGYLVISLEYPLSSKRRHTWNVAEPQLACALAWVGSNAAHFGGDAGRLALWGESAGGNLALNLSYRVNAGTLTPACSGNISPVRAVMALYPVVDPARMYRPVDPLLAPFGRLMGDNYTGGSPEQFPDRYKAIASVTHIHAKAPPTLLVVPQADHLVDPNAATAFASNAQAAGVETRLITMPYAEHAFDLRSGGIGNQMVRQVMLNFLKAHGLAP